MNMLQIAVFVLASAGLVYVSRAALPQPRSHGFYRFWAWEATLVLALLTEGARPSGFVTRYLGASSSPGHC